MLVQAIVDDIWEVFRAFLEDPSMKKAWHNYSFDRHVLGNVRAGGQPIRAAGFHADTMHMARLWDASRKGKGYSLEALSGSALLTLCTPLPCLPGQIYEIWATPCNLLGCSLRACSFRYWEGRVSHEMWTG